MSVQQIVAVMGRGVLTGGSDVITADDLGFTRGDGVFDATRVVTAEDGSSTIDNLDAHLDRFTRSLAGLDVHELDRVGWQQLIGQAVAAWQVPGEAILKIMWSRGQESSPSEPTQLLTITALDQAAIDKREGIKVALLGRGTASDAYRDAPWLLGGVKTLAYAVNVAVKREAARRGDDEVLLVSSDGYAMEGPNAALIVLKDGELWTTPTDGTGILASITQDLIWQGAAAEQVPTHIELMRPAHVLDADAAWLASSVRGTAPITRLDGKDLPTSAEWTQRLRRWIGFA